MSNPTESEVRDAIQWTAEKQRKHVEKMGGRMSRERSERIVRESMLKKERVDREQGK